MSTTVTIPEAEQDLEDTRQDILNLSAVVTHLGNFIRDAQSGDDRNRYRVDMFKYEGLRDIAKRLETNIIAKLEQLRKS